MSCLMLLSYKMFISRRFMTAMWTYLCMVSRFMFHYHKTKYDVFWREVTTDQLIEGGKLFKKNCQDCSASSLHARFSFDSITEICAFTICWRLTLWSNRCRNSFVIVFEDKIIEIFHVKSERMGDITVASMNFSS